jgi:very-short-patch-repair endonuclease
MGKSKKYNKIVRARELRKESTEAENILWECLKGRRFLNKKFRRQHIFHGFIHDFYCFENKIAIELDGLIHLKQKEYDVARQNIVKDMGIKILRLKNKDILKNIDYVLNTIKQNITIPSPSSMERDVIEKCSSAAKQGEE